MNGRGREVDVPVSWVPIAGLGDLARALLGEGRGDRDVIPDHVHDRVTALAKQWGAHGFTAETVGAWKDLDPAAAALLHARGVTPAVLQRHTVATPAGDISLWRAVISGALSAAEALDELPEEGPPAPPPAASMPRPAPAVFSHPVAALEPGDADRRGKSTPPQTPFRA
jgi:hypothetical protein